MNYLSSNRVRGIYVAGLVMLLVACLNVATGLVRAGSTSYDYTWTPSGYLVARLVVLRDGINIYGDITVPLCIGVSKWHSEGTTSSGSFTEDWDGTLVVATSGNYVGTIDPTQIKDSFGGYWIGNGQPFQYNHDALRKFFTDRPDLAVYQPAIGLMNGDVGFLVHSVDANHALPNDGCDMANPWGDPNEAAAFSGGYSRGYGGDENKKYFPVNGGRRQGDYGFQYWAGTESPDRPNEWAEIYAGPQSWQVHGEYSN